MPATPIIRSPVAPFDAPAAEAPRVPTNVAPTEYDAPQQFYLPEGLLLDKLFEARHKAAETVAALPELQAVASLGRTLRGAVARPAKTLAHPRITPIEAETAMDELTAAVGVVCDTAEAALNKLATAYAVPAFTATPADLRVVTDWLGYLAVLPVTHAVPMLTQQFVTEAVKTQNFGPTIAMLPVLRGLAAERWAGEYAVTDLITQMELTIRTSPKWVVAERARVVAERLRHKVGQLRAEVIRENGNLDAVAGVRTGWYADLGITPPAAP